MFEFLRWRHLPDRVLLEYRAGFLDNERLEMLEAHLLLCPTCQLQLKDLPPVPTPELLYLCESL